MWCPYVNWQNAKTICFSDKNVWPRLNRYLFFDFCYKTRMKMRDSERTWRIPSSPIVEAKHEENTQRTHWADKNRGKNSGMLERIVNFQKTRERIAASEGTWRIPSSPIVGEKRVVSLCKLTSVLIYRRIAKPFNFTVANLPSSSKWKGIWF